MIEETAIVTRIEDGQVWIKSLQGGACGGCMQQSSCGTASLSKWLPKREFAVESDQALTVGDQVRVGIDDSHVLLSSIVLYLLPILVMLLGVGLANSFLSPAFTEAWLPELSLGLLLATFWVIHKLQHVLLLYFCFRPQIVGRL
ncbi:SoxR reducing system RseC family protein [Methylomonas sp. SURF-2]|uniref:SoxR reducing system RseC family protein n=1 Tax=Methylomonas subterranea TaxID=2952225 RepID=A0ABT1TBJ8_9GAMM|nr:SoxR reducing system RseC family protein [Methylomonas sp. SURF-2]MCQ8102482.1 SoxR reducing system RseC family protein [Methylomonas sp. SURF-2]